MADLSPELAAAKAAMQAHWARIAPIIQDPAIKELDDEDYPAALEKQTALMREFQTEHAETLRELNPGKELLNFAVIEARTEEVLELDRKLRAAKEEVLQLAANMAEADQALVEEMLERLVALEAMTEEEWAAVEFPARERMREALEELRENREAFLSELPMERRRYWESR